MGISLFNIGRILLQHWQVLHYATCTLMHCSVDEQLQRVEGFAPITQFVPDSPKPRAVVDIGRVYAGQLKTVIRSESKSWLNKTTWHDRCCK